MKAAVYYETGGARGVSLLELAEDGGWTWKPLEARREGVEKSAERS
jgi:hypothetical protein